MGVGVRPEGMTMSEILAPAVIGLVQPLSVNYILAVTRKDAPGKWCLPGGKIEDTDASPVEALRREMLEESGFELSDEPSPFYVAFSERSRRLVIVYTCSGSRKDGPLTSADGEISDFITRDLFMAVTAFPDFYRDMFEALKRHRRR
jgi:8-oxo-dGTP pyrophosphatase MutT (NUDIX family)